MRRAAAATRGAAALLGLALLAVLGGGCVMDLPTGVLVDRPRVLGARLELADAPEQAQPRPGETFDVAWLVVPDDARFTYALTACVAAPSNQGLPGCAAPPFAVGLETVPSGAPRWTLTLPEDTQGTLLIVGVLCADGVPTVDAGEGLPGCEGEGSTTELVTFSVGIASEGPPNRHPAWPEEAFTVDGEPWPATGAELPGEGCAAQGELPQVGWLDPSVEEPLSTPIGLTTRVEDRETFLALVLGETPTFEERREELVITHVATAGRFARLRTEVFDDESAVGEVPWFHPDEAPPAEGQLVRFWMVLRDGRGGMGWTDRTLCLVP